VYESCVAFGCKISPQLARQNVISGDEFVDVPTNDVGISKWTLIPLPVEHLIMQVVDVAKTREGVIHPNQETEAEKTGKEGKGDASDMDVTYSLTRSDTVLYYVTYDMHSIGLSKIIVDDNSLTDLVIVYSEVAGYTNVWATESRQKVRMADKIRTKTGTPIGFRGCRFIHLISASEEVGKKVKFRAIRANYPLEWKFTSKEIDSDVLLHACRTNLLACVDGGVVDTCWRERVQWVICYSFSIFIISSIVFMISSIVFITSIVFNGLCAGGRLENVCKSTIEHDKR
jgi:hypothetical protein